MAKKIKIRRAKAFDVVEIVSLLLQGAAEQKESIWYPTPSMNQAQQVAHVLALIDKGLVVVAEQEVDARIVGAIGMTVCQDDWSDQWKMVNEWLYILPEFRDAAVDDNLLSYVEQWADSQVNPATQEGLPVMMAIVSGQDTELKDELMKRRGYQYAGGNFVRKPHVQLEETLDDETDSEMARTG